MLGRVAPPKARVQAPPLLEVLLGSGVTRERAFLGVQLGSLRHERGWNWNDLARVAGIRSVQVKGIEEGRRDPGFSTLVRLARALDLRSLDELLGPSHLEAAKKP